MCMSVGWGADRQSPGKPCTPSWNVYLMPRFVVMGVRELIIFILKTAEGLGRHTRELFRIIKMFIFLLMMMVIGVYKFVKTH